MAHRPHSWYHWCSCRQHKAFLSYCHGQQQPEIRKTVGSEKMRMIKKQE